MEKIGLEAVKAVISLAALANRLGITRSACAQWDRVPAERVGEVSRVTGLPKHVIRPDLHDAPASASEVA